MSIKIPVTKTQVGLGNVANTDTTTTANITDSSNKRFVTDTQITVLKNTSGTNTGDNATNSQYSGLATSKQEVLVSGTNIKTINSTSLLGSGNINLVTSPAGTSNQIQFNNAGAFGASSNLTYSNGQLLVTSPATTTIPAVIKGFSGQTANLQEWQNSSGTVLANISANGSLSAAGLRSGSALTAGDLVPNPSVSTIPSGAGDIGILRILRTGSNIGFGTGIVMSHDYVDKAYFNGINESASTGALAFFTVSSGAINEGMRINGSQNILIGTVTDSTSARLQIQGSNTANKVVTVCGAASQSANLQEWQNSSGTVLSAISASGDLVSNTTNGIKIGTATSQKLGFFNATPVVQQTGGAATATVVYTATEQGMLQKVYDAMRTFGFLS